MRLTTLLTATLLCSMSVVASAASYFIVVPFKGKAEAAANAISVGLAAAPLPPAVVGRAYAGFDLTTLLTVTGDPAFKSAQVTWALVEGVLPAGLQLSAAGMISGTPTAETAATPFTVKASYKTKSGTQSYNMAVTLGVSFELERDTLDFDTVSRGVSLTKSVTVNNTGVAALTLSAGSLPAGYSLNNRCHSIAAGGQCQLDVTFSPSESKNYLGQLSLTAENTTVSHRILLTGTGGGPSYAVLDPSTISYPNVTLSADRLTAASGGDGSTSLIAADKPKTSGKWYFEAGIPPGLGNCSLGLMPTASLGSVTMIDSLQTPGASYVMRSTQINASPYVGRAWGFDYGGGTIGLAYDLDNMTIQFVASTTTYGPYPLSMPAGTSYVPAVNVWGGCTMAVNFGQKVFRNPVPAGFNPGVF